MCHIISVQWSLAGITRENTLEPYLLISGMKLFLSKAAKSSTRSSLQGIDLNAA